jgi:membrane associated rhomboid family serine protease
MEEANQKKIVPFMTYFILVITFLIQFYLIFLSVDDYLRVYETYSLIPTLLFQGVHIDSLFTYIFLHGNLVHLIVNSIALYGAGTIVEREIGHTKFLGTFILSGIFAGIVHSYLNPQSGIPLVGASGAVFGIIAIMFLLMPFKITYALVVPMPSVIVGLMLTLVEISAFWLASDPGIAHDVHLAGFFIGGITAFMIDQKKASKGLVISIIILVLLYYLGAHFDLIPSMGLT